MEIILQTTDDVAKQIINNSLSVNSRNIVDAVQAPINHMFGAYFSIVTEDVTLAEKLQKLPEVLAAYEKAYATPALPNE